MSWFAVHTKALRERTANRDLQQKGFSTFYPVEKVRRIRRHVVYWTARPLFARWVFVDTDVGLLHCVLAHPGVAGIASMDGEPVAIPEDVMQALIAWARKGVTLSGDDACGRQRFKSSEKVQFKPDATLAGQAAVVVNDDGSAKVRVLLKILGGERTMLVPATSLQKAA